MKPLWEFRREQMTNQKYSVLVQPYLMGQYRIQLCNDLEVPGVEHHGEIVREMCTYSYQTAISKSSALACAKAPESLAASWATPKNCEFKGGRIRLDWEESE